MRFVFDLDGTLCFDGKTIAPEIKEVLTEASHYGHQIVFASARSYRDCIPVLGEELSQELVIGLNGGLAYDEGNLIFHSHLEEKGYKAVLSWCHRYNLPYFVDDDFHYSGQQIEKMPFASHVDPLHLAKQLPLVELKNPIKIVIEMSRHEDLVEDMASELTLLNVMDVSYFAHEKCLYINPYETNKATTIVDLLGNDFVAFGNDKNDKAMFKASLYSVQVGDYAFLEKYTDEKLPADSSAIAQKLKELYQQF
ncbi:HAD hydrolase family protein [Streptococcus hillyeri]|uniref:HAD family hydrolase n=1 Tax=Streptococcus hillyeri TaxID=2282420 RepID=A0A3L9E061_9STRE|nr:HAD hydrolase family protein [Streptococcus hillyeri]RLY05349.1 HAD family hydrolase [Streptococcus hillyeri]